jgi:hypothetical protein
MNDQEKRLVTGEDIAAWHRHEETATEAAVDKALRTLRRLVDGGSPDTFLAFPVASRFRQPELLAALRKLIEDIDGLEVPRKQQPRSMSRFGGPWSMDEECDLVQWFRAGSDMGELMRRHQRSEGGILFRLHHLGLIEGPDIPAFETERNEAAFLRAEQSYLEQDEFLEMWDRDRAARFDGDEGDCDSSDAWFDDAPEIWEEPPQPECCTDWSVCFDDMEAEQWEELMGLPEIEDPDIYYRSRLEQGEGD